jgi:hypothetical protein
MLAVSDTATMIVYNCTITQVQLVVAQRMHCTCEWTVAGAGHCGTGQVLSAVAAE